MHNKYYIFTIAVMTIGVLLMFDNLESAYAFSFTSYATGADANGAVRLGNYILVANAGVNTVRVFNINTPDTLHQTITSCTGCIGLFTYDNAVYAVGTSTLYKIEQTTAGSFIITDSVSTTSICANYAIIPSAQVVNSNGEFICVRPSADVYRVIDLASMTITFTSASLAPTCDQPNNAQWINNNYIVIACAVTQNLVTYESGQSVSTHTQSVTGLIGVTGGIIGSNYYIIGCDGQVCDIFTYTIAGGFTSVTTVSFTSSNSIGIIDNEGARFIIVCGNSICGVDPSDGTVLWSVGTVYTMGPNLGMDAYNDLLIYGAMGTSTDRHFVFDLSGLPTGTGGTQPDSGSGISCELPENANLLICRLGGSGSIVSAGDFLIGNGTNGTGLSGIVCSLGVVDCETNPDIKTNGVGYLFWLVALMVMVGIFWVAGRGDISSIPTFVWFIATIAITIAFTIMEFIDPTALIISIVVVIAFAVAKAKGILGGGGQLMNESA